jgi:hypothetical protein
VREFGGSVHAGAIEELEHITPVITPTFPAAATWWNDVQDVVLDGVQLPPDCHVGRAMPGLRDSRVAAGVSACGRAKQLGAEFAPTAG